MSIKKVQNNEQKKTAPLLRAFMNEKGLSYEELAKLWGGSKATAHALVKGESEPSYKILRSLRRTGMSIDTLIDVAEGFENTVAEHPETYKLETLPADERDLLRKYRQLNEADKGCALRMVAGLRGLEEQSKKNGETESNCKVMNFGSK